MSVKNHDPSEINQRERETEWPNHDAQCQESSPNRFSKVDAAGQEIAGAMWEATFFEELAQDWQAAFIEAVGSMGKDDGAQDKPKDVWTKAFGREDAVAEVHACLIDV